MEKIKAGMQVQNRQSGLRAIVTKDATENDVFVTIKYEAGIGAEVTVQRNIFINLFKKIEK